MDVQHRRNEITPILISGIVKVQNIYMDKGFIRAPFMLGQLGQACTTLAPWPQLGKH